MRARKPWPQRNPTPPHSPQSAEFARVPEWLSPQGAATRLHASPSWMTPCPRLRLVVSDGAGAPSAPAIVFPRNERSAHRLTSNDNLTRAGIGHRVARPGAASIIPPRDRMPMWAWRKGQWSMPETPSRTIRHVEHLEDADDAFRAVVTVVCGVIERANVPANERREVFAALQTCRRRLRLVVVDGQRIDAASAMLRTLAYTMELTPKVTRRLREIEADMERMEALASIDEPIELFPGQAA